MNPTNHSYFNLTGQGAGDILGHELTLYADRFMVIDKDFIPTGELRSVEGTAIDFRKPAAIGTKVGSKEEQVLFGLDWASITTSSQPPRRNAPRKGGKLIQYRGGLYLETQHFPDSPNNPSFPSTVLKAGERYRSTTVFQFSTAK